MMAQRHGASCVFWGGMPLHHAESVAPSPEKIGMRWEQVRFGLIKYGASGAALRRSAIAHFSALISRPTAMLANTVPCQGLFLARRSLQEDARAAFLSMRPYFVYRFENAE